MNAIRAGSIVLLHDGGSHAPTIAALPCMFDYLRRQGFSVVALADLLSGNFTDPASGWVSLWLQPGWRTLSISSTGPSVAAAQRAIIAAGIPLFGGADGIFGQSTLAALKTYQQRVGLPVTGVVDAATASAMGLSSGSTGVRQSAAAVRAAQNALIRGGIHVAGGATGAFSIGTYYAVRTFQRFQGLPVTGVIDAATARALGILAAPPPDSAWSNLAINSRSFQVAAAQRALMNLKIFVRGGATGDFTMYTSYAVQTFQRHHNLPVTGTIDLATARALGLFNDPMVNWHDARLGSSGSFVTRAEQALIAAGVNVAKGADGVFGIDTYYAVQTFQRYHNLAVTGIIDLATARALWGSTIRW